MSESTPSPTTSYLDRFRAGDPNALDNLLAHTCERLRQLARRMLKGYPQVGRWEQTDDVLQNALVRLNRALKAQAPKCALHYYHLATRHLRWELIDLKKHYQGPQGSGKKHHTDGDGAVLAGANCLSEEPSSVAEWAEFHSRVDALPDQEREVFGLLWYEGLTQEQAAEILCVDVRTIRRRWQSARLILGQTPGCNPLSA